jgi:hypothetical protein
MLQQFDLSASGDSRCLMMAIKQTGGLRLRTLDCVFYAVADLILSCRRLVSVSNGINTIILSVSSRSFFSSLVTKDRALMTLH